MVPVSIERSYVREKILGDSIRRVASDLRLIDLPDLVAYLKTSQVASIGALVQASIELSFQPDTLVFAYAGDVELEWDAAPKVSFDMEFHHRAVHVYFKLLLEGQQAGVEITYIAFDGARQEPEQNTLKLLEALRMARIN